jgi:hypothetical protein
MREIVAKPQSDTPKVTKLENGSYHVLAKDGDDFTIEGVELRLEFSARASFISVMLDDDEVCCRDVEGEPETAVFEILIPRPRLDMAIARRE